jgi:DNA repair exonuclease SbcCD ATPase subunit
MSETIETKDLIPSSVRNLVEKDLKAFIEGAKIQKIENDMQLQNVVDLTKSIKDLYKTIEAHRDNLVRPKNDEVKEINAYFKLAQTRLDALEKNCKSVVMEYQREQEQKRIEAQRKADEAARKERERIELEARAIRKKEEDERSKAEEARRKAERAKSDAERIRFEKEAEKAEYKADTLGQKAETKQSIAETVIAPIVQTVTKANGFSSVKKYRGEIKDLKAFVKYCLESDQMNFVMIDTAALDRVIQATKGAMRFPGIAVIETEETRVRK